MSQGPVFKKRFGNISVALFSEEKSTTDGKIFTSQNISLEKSWKDKDGEYQSSKVYLDPRDVLAVTQGLHLAYVASFEDKQGEQPDS